MSRTAVITPEEMVNRAECDRFAGELRRALDGGATALVIDCRGVRYMNSRAIGTLLETYMELSERQGALTLVGPDRVLRRGFEVVGLLSLIEVVDSLEEATGDGKE